MRPRASRNSIKPARHNSASISTAVRGREARTYADLAGAAQLAGFAVTQSQVHEWVMDRLLPSTGEQLSAGRHGFVTARQPRVTEQLLALCRWRRQTKSWHKLAVVLWAEGWPIDVERVRTAVLAWFPATPLPADPTDEQLDDWSRLAARLAPKLGALLGLGRVGPAAADGLYQGILIMAGQGAESLDEEGAAAIESAAGMRPRARIDRLSDQGPWLTGSALDGLSAMRGRFTRDRLRSLVQLATAAELEAVRPRVGFFLIALPEFVRAMELLQGRNFMGLGALPRLIARAPEIGLPIALFFSAEMPQLGDVLDRISEGVRSVPSRATIDAVESYIAQHPEQAVAIRRAGLQRLIECGETVVIQDGAVATG